MFVKKGKKSGLDFYRFFLQRSCGETLLNVIFFLVFQRSCEIGNKRDCKLDVEVMG